MSSESSSGATTAPWADLLSELCNLVRERLDPISIIRFPAVCRDWSAACEVYPLLRPGAPALLTPDLDSDGLDIEHSVEAGAFYLHDVSACGGGRKSFLGEAEGLKDRAWISGNHGWLVTTDMWCDVQLLNPVTGARVCLPSFSTISEVKGHDHFSVFIGSDYFVSAKDNEILKVALCRTPAHANGHLAVAIFSKDLLAFTAAGSGGEGEGGCKWTAVKNPAADDVLYMDAIVLDRKLFAVDEVGRIYSWHQDGGATTMEPTVVQGPNIDDMSLQHDYDRCGFYLAASGDGHQ